MKVKNIVMSIALLLMANFASAVTVEVGPVNLDWVAVVYKPAFGHVAGNIEIQITNGISDMKGLNCSNTWVTTRAENSPAFNQLYSTLMAAQVAQKPVRIGLTDDPASNAYGGRCSLVSVALTK